MALIQCPACRRYMGSGLTRCMYCNEKLQDKNIPIIETGLPRSEEKPKVRHRFCRVLIALAGMSLTAIGCILFSPLPLLGVPLFLLGGWILLKKLK